MEIPAATSSQENRRLRKPRPKKEPTVFVRRLGAHHFAHLRAVAQGIDLAESAYRYLGIEHGHEAASAHAQTMEAVRSIARRTGERNWRLIGLAVRLPAQVDIPSLEAFIDSRHLDGWSEAEVVEMYEEAYPPDRRLERRHASLRRLLDLITKLQSSHVEEPKSIDAVDGWFDDTTAKRLISAGFVTLGDLRYRIDAGGRWFATMPGVGRKKAERIVKHMDNLLPPSPTLLTPLNPVVIPAGGSMAKLPWMAPGQSVVFDLNRGSAPSAMIAATNDADAIAAWIHATATSPHTRLCYIRESTRLLLWLQEEQVGSRLRDMDVNISLAYKDFLADIPPRWISRNVAKRGETGWRPFKGKLSIASQRQALIIISSMFQWMQSVGYLTGSPWIAINKRLGDDKGKLKLDTKSISESAMAEIKQFIDAQPPSPSSARIKFVVDFLEAVGLRSAELIGAKLSQISKEPEGWVMAIHGKGSKNRTVVIPGQAYEAIQHYLASRGHHSLQEADPDCFLLSSISDPGKPIGYRALYDHVKSWLRTAIASAELSRHEKDRLAGASTHWLRHTFGTRAVARGVPLDVVQAQLGHASPETTARNYSRAPLKRRVDELAKAFEEA